MQLHDFRFKGQMASSFKVAAEVQARYIRPAIRQESVVIPGRSGTLTLPDGMEPAFEVIHHSPTCWLMPGGDINAVAEWLTGSGLVVFGSMQDRAYQARIVNQIPFSAGADEGLPHLTFMPIFECQPLALRLPEANDIEVTASGALIQNPGNIASAPIIRIEGSGDISLTIGGRQADLTGIEGGIKLDFEMMEATNLEGTALLGHKVQGEALLLPKGDSALIYTGEVTKITITPRWRLL